MKSLHNHTFKNFEKYVDDHFKNLDILKYYPYGKEKKWTHWICGARDLTKEYKDRKYLNKTDKDIVFSIINEITRAMYYLVMNGKSSGFTAQREEAFALCKLFHSGYSGWSKEIIKDKSIKEIHKIEKFNRKRSDKVIGDKFSDYTLSDEQKIERREKYGVYVVEHFPLSQYSSTTLHPQLLYTRRELCAISLIVDCLFENLC